jgi:hypothetical protein
MVLSDKNIREKLKIRYLDLQTDQVVKKIEIIRDTKQLMPISLKLKACLIGNLKDRIMIWIKKHLLAQVEESFVKDTNRMS